LPAPAVNDVTRLPLDRCPCGAISGPRRSQSRSQATVQPPHRLRRSSVCVPFYAGVLALDVRPWCSSACESRDHVSV
jgi:hypothetical protein